MKREIGFILLLLLCGLCGVACAGGLPPDVATALDDPKWDGYQVAAVSSHGGNESFAAQYALIMKKGDHNVLCMVEKEPGAQDYSLVVETDRAIYQGDLLPSLLIDTGGDALFYTYRYESGGLRAETYHTVKQDGVWHIPTLMLYYAQDADGLYPETQVWLDGDALHYAFSWCDENDNIVRHGEPQSTAGVPLGKYLHSFDIASLPHDPSAVQAHFAIPENQATTYNLGDYLDRVKLRSKPSSDGRILGQYFYGVPVDVIDNQGKWCHVAIGEREGYMMTEFLSLDDDPFAHGISGYVRYPQTEGTLPLYAAADTSSAVLVHMPTGYVQVLGTIGGDWLHILFTDHENGGGRMIGYASSAAITHTDNFATVAVDTGDAAMKQNLRAEPSRDANVMAQIFNGTELYWMFDDHTNGDGWERVRVGGALGYMRTDDLDFSSGPVHGFVPPLSRALQDPLPLYDTATATPSSGSIPAGTAFAVLGTQGDRYLLRIETGEPYVYTYQYADKSAVQPVTASASTQGILISEQAVYWINEDGLVASGDVVPAGAHMQITGSVSEDGKTSSAQYVDPTMYWLVGEVSLGRSSLMSGCVPRESVRYDPLLEYDR